MDKPFYLFIPDHELLFAIAKADALDLLLLAATGRLVITDLVSHVATQHTDDVITAKKLHEFLIANRNFIETEQTYFGKLVLDDLQSKQLAGEDATLHKDTLSTHISSLISEMRDKPRAFPTHLLLADKWFENNVYKSPANTELLSTSVWLQNLQDWGVINSAVNMKQKIFDAFL